MKPKHDLQKKLMLLLNLCFVSIMVFGQMTITDENNTEIRALTERTEPSGWLYFKESSEVKPGDLFTELKPHTGLGAEDEMILDKEWGDQYGYGHRRYQQYHKSVKVEKAQWLEHYRICDSVVKIASGKLIEGLAINEIPTFTESQALDSALQNIGATEYAWQNQAMEDTLKAEMEDPNATHFPTGELLIGLVLGHELSEENYRLTWKFQIYATNPFEESMVYVDAHTGEVLKRKSVAMAGTAPVLYRSGMRSIDTKKAFLGKYHLKANDIEQRKIKTRRGTRGSNPGWSGASKIKDSDDVWDASNIDGTTAHWGVTQAWNYFAFRHSWEGFDNDGKKVRVFAGSSKNNAFFWPSGTSRYDELEFGSITLPDGTVNEFSSLDMCGHEFTHGVINHIVSGGMTANEPGALNESFSDIFGMFSERWVDFADAAPGSPTPDWLILEDVIPGGDRSFENPPAFNHPDT